jgi:Rrf2 family protein
MSEGVEWAAHACALLAASPKPLSGARLAAYHDLPAAYMAKHLQALARAGLVESARGPGGGYSLARPPAAITLLDIAEAIEGSEPAFRCTEIRRRGPCPTPREACKRPCGVAAGFWRAEEAWRASLAETTLVHILADAATSYTPERGKAFLKWLEET